MNEILKSRIERAFTLTRDLVDHLGEGALGLDLPNLPSNRIAGQLYAGTPVDVLLRQENPTLNYYFVRSIGVAPSCASAPGASSSAATTAPSPPPMPWSTWPTSPTC